MDKIPNFDNFVGCIFSTSEANASGLGRFINQSIISIIIIISARIKLTFLHGEH